jgi:hypothetical protein
VLGWENLWETDNTRFAGSIGHPTPMDRSLGINWLKECGQTIPMISKANSRYAIQFVRHSGGWPHKRAGPLDSWDDRWPSYSLPVSADYNVRFGSIQAQAHLSSRVPNQKLAVIDMSSKPFGRNMEYSEIDTMYLHVPFDDKPSVGVGFLFIDVIVPFILFAIQKGYMVLVNCTKGQNRCAACVRTCVCA